MFKTMIYGGIEYNGFVIDELGNIKNLKTGFIYKFSINKAGYAMVYLPLGKRGKVKAIRVHKAVAETYIPNKENYKVVHHKDGNKKNPCVNNLEWVTHKKNTEYHLLEESKKTEFYNNRKLAEDDVRLIRAKKGFMSANEIAKMFSVSKTTIINIWNYHLYRNIA